MRACTATKRETKPLALRGSVPSRAYGIFVSIVLPLVASVAGVTAFWIGIESFGYGDSLALRVSIVFSVAVALSLRIVARDWYSKSHELTALGDRLALRPRSSPGAEAQRDVPYAHIERLSWSGAEIRIDHDDGTLEFRTGSRPAAEWLETVAARVSATHPSCEMGNRALFVLHTRTRKRVLTCLSSVGILMLFFGVLTILAAGSLPAIAVAAIVPILAVALVEFVILEWRSTDITFVVYDDRVEIDSRCAARGRFVVPFSRMQRISRAHSKIMVWEAGLRPLLFIGQGLATEDAFDRLTTVVESANPECEIIEKVR